MADNRNETERLLNAAVDHIEDTHEQPTDLRAWDHLLIYCPDDVIAARRARMDFRMGWERIWRTGEYAQGREWQNY